MRERAGAGPSSLVDERGVKGQRSADPEPPNEESQPPFSTLLLYLKFKSIGRLAAWWKLTDWKVENLQHNMDCEDNGDLILMEKPLNFSIGHLIMQSYVRPTEVLVDGLNMHGLMLVVLLEVELPKCAKVEV